MKKLLVALVLVAVMVFGPFCLAYAAPLPGSWSPVGSPSVSAANVKRLTTVNGTLYAGTNGNGVLARDGSAWSHVGILSGFAAYVYGFVAVNGTLYVGTYRGVWGLPMPPRLATVTATGNISALTVGGNGLNLNQLTVSGRISTATHMISREWR